jgi:hypothetical protein
LLVGKREKKYKDLGIEEIMVKIASCIGVLEQLKIPNNKSQIPNKSQ